MKIGDTIWIFDQNRRVYPKGGGIGKGPIWREHWRPEQIIGETKRSWLVGSEWRPIKVDKKEPRQRVAFSQEEIDLHEFVECHGHRIADAIGRIRDYATLKRIADLIGYKP